MKLKNICVMELFILNCVNECHEVVKVKAFKTFEEAKDCMLLSYQRELDCALEDFDQNEIESEICEDFARVIVSEDDYAYWWSIDKVNV